MPPNDIIGFMKNKFWIDVIAVLILIDLNSSFPALLHPEHQNIESRTGMARPSNSNIDHFSTLPHELLVSIAGFAYDHDRWFGQRGQEPEKLSNLSLVNKALRNACLPFLFRAFDLLFTKESFENLSQIALSSNLALLVREIRYYPPLFISKGMCADYALQLNFDPAMLGSLLLLTSSRRLRSRCLRRLNASPSGFRGSEMEFQAIVVWHAKRPSL
jgi:hypothetical protein